MLGLSFRFIYDRQPGPPHLFFVKFLSPFVLPDTTLILLTLSGAIGGVLYAIRNKELVFPHKIESGINPGYLGDCFFGMAGAYVISLIVPGDFPSTKGLDVQLITQVLATGIIGGYGGRSIIDRALDNILSRQDELEKKVKGNSQNIETVQQQSQSGAQALALLERYFDEDLEHTDEEVKDIKELIKKSSSREKAIIFVDAKKVRAKNVPKNPPMVGRTVPVFEALVAVGADAKFLHRYHAQLGYALQGKSDPDWSRAKAMLSKAIEIRKISPDNYESFWVYEFNRAICGINLDPNFKKDTRSLSNIRESILNDLTTASEYRNRTNAHLDEYLTKLDKRSVDEIYKWLRLNDISLKEVGLPKQPSEMSSSNGSNESHADGVAGQKTLLEFGGSSPE